MSRGPSHLNCLVAIDKPLSMTSHDVVSHLRRVVGEKRVGHGGTLDPDASGVLICGIGQGTRLMGMLTLDTKAYEVGIRLGSETTTDDASGEVVAEAPVDPSLADPKKAQAVLDGLVGDTMQVPPSFSAISVDGVRAYARARSGEKVELEPRPVTIYDARLLEVVVDDQGILWSVALSVSKGTYVRSIARDLGRDLGCYGHVETLRRTASGRTTLEDAIPLDVVETKGEAVILEKPLDPVAALDLPVRQLRGDEVEAAACGKTLPVGEVQGAEGSLASGDRVSLVDGSGDLCGVWEVRGDRLRCVTNFPQPITGVRHG